MNEIVSAVLWQMGAYVFVFVVSFFLLNKLLGGILTKWLKVRTNQTKKVLVNVKTIIGVYHAVGEIVDGFLIFTDKKKVNKRVAIQKGCFYRNMGVNMIDFDDDKGCIINVNLEAVSGHDPQKSEDLYTRSLMRPNMIEELLKKLLIACLIVAILAVIFSLAGTVVAYTAGKNNGAALVQLAEICKTTVSAGTSLISGGNVATGVV
jgi:hypothetical protein